MSAPTAPTAPIDYAAEKAAAAARKRAVWADAEQEFTAWYQDVSTRAERNTGGQAGIHYGQRITTLPKCYCGKATAALGMCITHYVRWWRQLHGQITGRRNQRAMCHPDRKHHGHGLCRACNQKRPDVKRAQRIQQIRGALLQGGDLRCIRGGRLAWNCPHHDRKAHARGLCQSCYEWLRYHQKGNADAPVPDAPPKMPVRRRCRQHADRPHYARGLCASCYSVWLKRRARGRTKRWVRPPGTPLVCGHDRPRVARDLCSACYQRWRWHRRSARSRQRPYRAPILCGHPTRKHHAKSCCQSCWRRGIWKCPGFLAGAFTDQPAPRKRRTFKGVRKVIRCGHSDRRYVALGRCGPCYWQYRRDLKAPAQQLAA